MDEALRKLCLHVLTDNIVSPEFNDLIIETGLNLETEEWDIPNKMLNMADNILVTLGSKSREHH